MSSIDAQIEALCAELSKIPDEASRRRFLNDSRELLTPQIVERLAEAVRRELRVDVPKALALAEAALTIAGELSDKAALARALRAQANALWFMGQCRSAVDLFKQAASLFEESGEQSEVGRTLSTSIQSLALLGEYDAAVSAAERAGEIFAQLGDTLRLARLEINLANVYHRQNRFSEALAAYERAYQQLLPHKDMEGIGVALHNIAVCLIALDDFPGALETYRRVREFSEQHDMPLLVAQADYNIAYLFYLRGDYTHALELLRVTRETCRKNEDAYHLGLCDLDQSEIYLELSLIEDAAEMAQKSFEQFQKIGVTYEAARALTNLATAVSLEGNSSRGLEIFGEAREMFVRERNQVWPSLLDLYQALILFNEGQFAEARRLCVAALELFRSLAMPSKHLLCHLLLARLSHQEFNLDGAMAECKSALGLLASVDSPILSFQTHFLLGQIQETLRQPEDAYASYQVSRRELETLRTSLQAEELKIAFMKNKVEVYARLVQLCVDRGSGQSSTDEAFAYIEEAKSRTLRDLIFGRVQPRNSNADEESETERRIQDLRQSLNWYYHRIEREQLSQDGISPESIEALTAQAQKCEHELIRMLREQPCSNIAGTVMGNSKPLTIAEIREAIDSETALVEYFAIGERIIAAVLTRDCLEIIPVTVLSRVTAHMRLLHFQMSKFRLSGDYLARFQKPLLRATQDHLRELYDDVFAPALHLLNVRHVVIVPFGPLHSLPFHALFDGERYLIDRFTISYAPSAGIYALCHREAANTRGPSLILGVDDPKTPFIREEAQAVAGVLPESELLLGSQATERALREKGRSSRLIHIASHGYFLKYSPMFSAIRLADSYLTLYDLYHMNLPVELLTLSGCVTGLSAIEEGDELLGLARGLLYSGARSLLLSHWDVDDRSTADFMKVFYSRLLNGSGKAEALQGAIRELRAQYPHPYHWAAFKLMGSALNS
ncbi:MAG: CHAT domain-containing protein [Acidobacteriaceae bacterium]|nr:CHAT domain-containing protein [Acidobacteriaceae bacterium]MBV9779397.1 CHAT domain-containing protein [Acidobacteriaceae bacterium]